MPSWVAVEFSPPATKSPGNYEDKINVRDKDKRYFTLNINNLLKLK